MGSAFQLIYRLNLKTTTLTQTARHGNTVTLLRNTTECEDHSGTDLFYEKISVGGVTQTIAGN